MNITVLIENKTYDRNILAEHGLSLLIGLDNETVLFDTGASNKYLDNINTLGIDIDEIDYLVLSHGHYDHTGGLEFFPKENNIKSIYMHKDATIPKYALRDETKNDYYFNGIPWDRLDESLEKLIVKTEHLVQIGPAIYVLGDISDRPVGNRFFVKQTDRFILDDFHDEQVLIIDENDELSVFMGCSHFGVVKGLETVKSYFPDKHIKNLIAGMHLGSKSDREIKAIIEKIDSFGIDNIIPLHCTGMNATALMKTEFKKLCHLLASGDKITL